MDKTDKFPSLKELTKFLFNIIKSSNEGFANEVKQVVREVVGWKIKWPGWTEKPL